MALSVSPPTTYYDFRNQRHHWEASPREPARTVTLQAFPRCTYTEEWTADSMTAQFTEPTKSPARSLVSSPTSCAHPPSMLSESPSELLIEDLLDVSALEDGTGWTDFPSEPSSEDLSRSSHESGVTTEFSNVGRRVLLEGEQLHYRLVSTRACPLLTCRKNFKTPLALRHHIKTHYRTNPKQAIRNALVPTDKISYKPRFPYPPGWSNSPFGLDKYHLPPLKGEDYQASPFVAEVDRHNNKWADERREKETKQLQFHDLTQESMLIYSRDDLDTPDSFTRLAPTENRLKIFRPHFSSGSPFDITLTEIITSSSISPTTTSNHSSMSLPSFSTPSISDASVYFPDTPLNVASPILSPVDSNAQTISHTKAAFTPDLSPSHTADALPAHLDVEHSPVDHNAFVNLAHHSKSLLFVQGQSDTEEREAKRARIVVVSSSRTTTRTLPTRRQQRLIWRKSAQTGSETESTDQGLTSPHTSDEIITPLRRKNVRPRKIPLNQVARWSLPFSDTPQLGTSSQPRPVKRGRPPKSKAATPSVSTAPVSVGNEPLLISRSQCSASDVKIGTDRLKSQEEMLGFSSSEPVYEPNPSKKYPRRKRKMVIYPDSDVDDHEPAEDTYVEEENLEPRKRRIRSSNDDREEEYQDRPRKGRGKKYPCTIQGCDSTFVRKSDIDRHIERIHRRVSHLCPSCNLAFSRTDAVLRHMRVLHGTELGPDERAFETIQT
ncbi:hypothetical protein E1B28_010083 [Marasmius oreades]|uniref:C2H2-type domain-containing protein n=1 Tax=Marasmius oreades TaxID=181124 RepID=A0A9P7UQS2_9AGAR|nr:uncharacterized protein E1B28_010083 [Marasmius oreades]KAG7091022.1 hypothetical protein E1B28_010083 [Marasmius oreades]